MDTTAGETKQLSPELQAQLEKIATDEGFTKPLFQVEDGSKSGDGFMGVLLRVTVTQQQEDNSGHKPAISLVVKFRPPVAQANLMFRVDLAFQNEILFYQRIQPVFIAFQTERGIPLNECAPTSPRCFDTATNIILEDMRPLGYSMKEGNYILDFHHCAAFLRELGRLHAVSFAIKDQQPDVFKVITKDIVEAFISTQPTRAMMERFDSAVKMAVVELKKRVTLPDKERYVEILERYNKGYYKKLTDLLESWRAEPYTVINHGDTWTNNVLFRYDTSDKAVPTGTCLIDFQIIRANSPVIDVSYVIFMCTTKSLRDQHYEDLLAVYYDSLANFMIQLGSDPEKMFPRSAFQDQLKQFSKFSLGLVIHETPVFSYVPVHPPPTRPDWGDNTDTAFEPAFNLSHGGHDTCWSRICDAILDMIDLGYVQ